MTVNTADATPLMPITRESLFDPPPGLAELPPVSPVRLPSGARGWLVTEHAKTRSWLADPRFSSDRRSSEVGDPRLSERFRQREDEQPGLFISNDPPEHTHYRKLLTGQFTVRRMRALEPRIESIVTEHLDGLAASAPPADLVSAFALPVPSMVICELLGVAYESRGEFQELTKTLLSLDASAEESLAASNAIKEFMLRLAMQKRKEPNDDMISGLIRDSAKAGTPLSDEELSNMGLLLLIAGHETTANMLGLGTFALLQNPEQMRTLRENLELMPGAVEELMRYLTIVGNTGLPRSAMEDMELDGVHIAKGQTVLFSLSQANRDAALVPNPDQLDVTRPRSHHVGFGHGIHQCLGQQLARVEMQIGFRELLRRFPTLELAVAAEDVPMRSDMTIYGVHELPVTW